MDRPSTDEMMAAVSEYMSLFATDRANATIDDLIAALARLMHVGARMQNEDTEEFDDDVSRDAALALYRHAREVATVRFPALELYPSYRLPVEDEEGLLSDPYDDIGDIYCDLAGVARLATTGHTVDARWDFRFGFETHWGLHAAELLHYLLRARIA